MISTPTGEAAGSRRLRWTAAAIVAVGAAVYFGSGLIFAYTSDAYVHSDFVEAAPEVAGVVDRVFVGNDEKVAVGAPLASLDPAPFRLAVALRQRRIDGAASIAAVKGDEGRVLAADLDAAKAAATFAQQEYDRISALVKDGAVSQAVLDRQTDARAKAKDAVAAAEAKFRVNSGETTAALADVATAKAELALAQYDLARTRLAAPVEGFVTNLTVRPGDYASVGVPLIGLVDDTQWRVVANFKEYVASRMTPGMRAWVWLDSAPWRFYPARVVSVGRGVARHDIPGRLLPYVAPTTDWIRLARRLQVTLVLDPKPDVPLFMGADARVILFF